MTSDFGGYDIPKKLSLGFEGAFERAYKAIRTNVPCILYGPPGTGKTFMLKALEAKLSEDEVLGLSEIIQFHRKFSYEDFIEGFAPNEEGSFRPKSGVFKQFCREVSGEKEVDLFVIDEINRAELSTTLGEVLYLIEDRQDRSLKTSHFADDFSIPLSVSIIGTMNIADRNISMMDFAIRRRFRFIPLFPDYVILRKVLLEKGWVVDGIDIDSYCRFAEVVNTRITNNKLMGRHMQLGHMMFVPDSGEEGIRTMDLLDNATYTIIPQLEAYCGFGNESILTSILNPDVANSYLNNLDLSTDQICAMVNEVSESLEIDETAD